MTVPASGSVDVRHPWGNHVQVIDYREIQFTKAPAVLRAIKARRAAQNRGSPARAAAEGTDRVTVVQVIRDARLDELHDLEELQRRASDVWEEYRDQLAAHPDAVQLEPSAIRGGYVRVAVGADGGRLGFSAVVPVRDGVWELDGLFVEPETMGTGVGRSLMADVVAHARREAVRHIGVIANPRAIGFYEKVGFQLGESASTRFGPARRMHLYLEA